MAGEAAMHSQLDSIMRGLNQANGKIVDLSRMQAVLQQVVQGVSTTQDLTRSELNQLRAEFADFLQRDLLSRNLQLAQTQIIAVRQELDTRYGHFATVRRLATGTLQGMDAGIVTHETVQAAAEELMITTPGYWLAPALVGLAAWIRDDRELAGQALAEALRRDSDKTSLFFALVLRRQQRNAATARWLTQYVTRQDPGALSREFTVVLDAAATGALGPDARPLVLDHLSTWYDRLCADPEVVRAQVVRWRELIDGMREPIAPGFVNLAAISPTWGRLKALYEGATVHRRAEAHFRSILDPHLEPDPGLQERVDDILDTLVTSFDAEEAPHRRRESELQAIIEHGGDTDAAARAHQARAAAHEQTVDLLTLVSNAGIAPEQVGATDTTRRLAIALARDWIVTADGQLEAENLRALPDSVELRLEGWQGRIGAGTSERQLVGSLAAHINRETAAAEAAVKLGPGPVTAFVAAGIALLLVLVTAIKGSPGGAVFFLLVALATAGWAGYRYSQLQPLRDRIHQQGEVRRTNACAKLNGAIAETVDWRSAWDREIDHSPRFRAYLAGLAREAFLTTTAHDRREVLT